MDSKKFNSELRALITEIAGLPADQQKRLQPLIQETERRQREITKNMNDIAMSFVDLRICVKYLLFDLEATRRERNDLKDILDNQSPDDKQSEDSRGL